MEGKRDLFNTTHHGVDISHLIANYILDYIVNSHTLNI